MAYLARREVAPLKQMDFAALGGVIFEGDVEEWRFDMLLRS